MKCPYCKSFFVIGSQNHDVFYDTFRLSNEYESSLTYVTNVFVCPNEKCKKLIINSELYTSTRNPYTTSIDLIELIVSKKILPKYVSKQYPDYVPKQIIDDYNEAISIIEDSPKASATLSRRCIQGMIRDYWEVSKSRLIDEIHAIKDKVDSVTWKAIDATRNIGNIGAHMEKDVNIIIDVDPNEAQLLIELIEYLIETWYIEKHERDEKLNKLIKLGEEKEKLKKGEKKDD
jgi:hypothetical protein